MNDFKDCLSNEKARHNGGLVIKKGAEKPLLLITQTILIFSKNHTTE